MRVKDGLIVDFQPKFRNLDEDHERYLTAVSDLHDEGIIEEVEGQSLYASHVAPGYVWIDAQYWERGLHDLIEAYHCYSGEIPFGPLYVGTAAAVDRFVEVGQPQRARRIWRNHLGHLKKFYWWYADEKRKGFRMAKNWLAPEAEQRADHERIVAKLPGIKAEMLEIMGTCRAWMVATDAPDRELAMLDRDIADVEAERRSPPPGKADPRAMDEALFWEIIETGLGTEPIGERIDALPERLARFKAKPIRDFAERLREADRAAYRHDIWALAYLLRGGCSDDSFDGFRAWLILQGRAVYEGALANPDGFDPGLFLTGSDGCQAVLDSAEIAYELRAGKAMRPLKAKAYRLEGPEIAEEDFPAHLPTLAAAVGWED